MLCKELDEKLIDYIDGMLDEYDTLAVKNHIEHCEDCKDNLDKLKEGMNYIEKINKNIETPHNLMKNVKKEVENKRNLTRKPKVKIGYVALVSILMTLLITGVFANESIQTYLEEWKNRGVKESQSIEQLIADEYGEKLNLISKDQNIKVTVESVVADDINTVLLIQVEDLKGEKKYAPILWDNTIIANGSFNDYLPGNPDAFEMDKARIKGSFLLHTPEKNKTRTVLSLSPIASKHDEIELIINALQVITEEDTTVPHAMGGQYYYDKHSEDIIEGLWSFKVPVKTSESIVIDINEEMVLDGNKIIFNQLKVSPTMSTLTYKFNKRQNKEYIIDHLNNISIEADGKLYEMKSYGRGSMRTNNYGPSEGTISFDTMYFQIPKKIKITVDGYNISVDEKSILEVDVSKSFPQEFRYLNSKIRVTNIQGDENIIRISMDNLGEKYFDRLLFKVFVNGTEYIEAQYAVKSLFPNDNKNNQVSSYDILLNNTTNTLDGYPAEGYGVNERYINYSDYGSGENLVEEVILNDTLDDKIESVQVRISGYEEQRDASGSLSVKLNK